MQTAPAMAFGPSGPAMPAVPGAASERAEFAEILAMAGDPGPARDADEARRAAERLVSVVLVQPILKQVRETNQAAPPFAPTSGQKQFQSMLDAKLAQEITRSARFPLVERLARDMRERSPTDATAAVDLRG